MAIKNLLITIILLATLVFTISWVYQLKEHTDLVKQATTSLEADGHTDILLYPSMITDCLQYQAIKKGKHVTGVVCP